ncbi:4432_t:CDS:1 [Gigaspora margarita]|uniref:4432_t:CDS:1 n=1 Tax=Gigaspora margarita TaxID=4874 RepID=A0ABN7WFU1_GIGMA|nr:4432_t:CDS:1 [Gigaspora margarita]
MADNALIVSQEPSISLLISESYPSISDLLKQNGQETMAFLKSTGAFYPFRLRKEIEVEEKGDNNFKTWEEYRNAIEMYLETICNEVKAKHPKSGIEISFKEHLRIARKDLATEIHDQHYKKFPFWPSIGQKQKSKVELDVKDNYESHPYRLFWSCIGWINVKDCRSKDKYYAHFDGRPDIKLLVFDLIKLNTIETLAKADFKLALEKIGGVKQALTWEDI